MDEGNQRTAAWFATTHWTVVANAGQSDPARARDALEQLIAGYWSPLYAFARRWGYGCHDAEDLTQGFFLRLLEKESLAGLERGGGRFRSFLLASFKHYVINERAKGLAIKRGGGKVVPLQLDTAEVWVAQLTSGSPEEAYERRWATTILEAAHRRLESEHREAGKGELFENLRFALLGRRGAVPYAELAERLGMSEGALKVAVHRLRERYRAVLRETVAATVNRPEEVEDELRYLQQVLSRP